jgi:hypothetical protein
MDILIKILIYSNLSINLRYDLLKNDEISFYNSLNKFSEYDEINRYINFTEDKLKLCNNLKVLKIYTVKKLPILPNLEKLYIEKDYTVDIPKFPKLKYVFCFKQHMKFFDYNKIVINYFYRLQEEDPRHPMFRHPRILLDMWSFGINP